MLIINNLSVLAIQHSTTEKKNKNQKHYKSNLNKADKAKNKSWLFIKMIDVYLLRF